MRCARCNGLMVSELSEDAGIKAVIYRCIHCGDVIDPKILHHRRNPQPRPPKRSRTPVVQRVLRNVAVS
jgi:hypothetical protein